MYFISVVSKGTVVHNLSALQNTEDFPIRHSYFVHFQLWYAFYCTTREKLLMWHECRKRSFIAGTGCLAQFVFRPLPHVSLRLVHVGLLLILLISHYFHIFLVLGLNLLCFTLHLLHLSTSTKDSRFRKSDSKADVCNAAVFMIKPGLSVPDGDSYLMVQSLI